MKKLLLKKCTGSGELIAALFAIMTILGVLVFFINTNMDFSTKSRVDEIVREYALIAETQGGLTAANKTNMCNELDKIKYLKSKDSQQNQYQVTTAAVNCPEAGSMTYGAPGEIKVELIYDNYIARQGKKVLRVFGIKNESMNQINMTVAKTFTSKY